MIMVKYIIFIFLVLSMETIGQTTKIELAITKGSGSASYERYIAWLQSLDSNLVIHDLYGVPFAEAMQIVERADGLVLSGGADVHPGRYGREADSSRCVINLERDTLEFAAIELSLKRELPIFAICRGEQILNVALGGTLIVDIPQDHDTIINHSCPDKFAMCHKVSIIKGSQIYEINKEEWNEVNSSHHQAVEKLGVGLKATSFSPDGVIESYEWENPSGKPYMMAVQWHPERMPKGHALGDGIAVKYLEEVRRRKK